LVHGLQTVDGTMKQCPQCRHDYSADLNFCLEDGSVLKPKQDDDRTWVLPQPQSTITAVDPQLQSGPTIGAVGPQNPPGPTTAAPQPARSRARKVLGTIGIIFGVTLYALIKIAPWSDRWKTQASENTNTAPISTNFAPSPTVSEPLTVPSPSASESSSPDLSPSPSPTPSTTPTPVEPADQSIMPGVYATTFQPNNRPEDALGLRTVRLVFTFKSDGSYTIQAYRADMNDRLYQEESGKYTQSNGQIKFNERIARHFDWDNEEWTGWESSSSAADTVRNITPASFELYSNGNWLFVKKMY